AFAAVRSLSRRNLAARSGRFARRRHGGDLDPARRWFERLRQTIRRPETFRETPRLSRIENGREVRYDNSDRMERGLRRGPRDTEDACKLRPRRPRVVD